jgi:ribonuclease T
MSDAAATVTPTRRGCRPDGARFRGFLPVVVDVETGGFNPRTDALLEIAAVLIELRPTAISCRASPGAITSSLSKARTWRRPRWRSTASIPGIRCARRLPERDALQRIFREVRTAVREHDCTRAILVGHNAFFDLQFLNAAIERCGIKRNPFHPFSSFDTATLGGIAYGQTVLSRIVEAAGLAWDSSAAHSAGYDAQITAEVFCAIVNSFRGIYEGR